MNNETCYENYCSKLSQRGKTYRVQDLWEDQTVYIKEPITSAIAEKAKEDPYLVAIILAITKSKRTEGTVKTSVKKPRGTDPDKPTDEILLNSIVDILSKYSAVEVIDQFQELKWYELKNIISSDNALKDYEQYIS